jgi:glyceraldehyde 3-phosphate dehydrogenase
LAAINARADSAQLAHLLKYDSVHRRFDAEVDHEPDAIIINGKPIAITRASLPG